MPMLMFPDNTALINFAVINRMDLLNSLTRGHGRWCATVATECAESAQFGQLSALEHAIDIFGEPYYPDQAELQDARILRDQLAGPGDPATKHFGEAETIAIVVRRQLNCVFITDDKEAQRLASSHGVRTADTWRLLKMARRAGLVDDDTLWGYVQTLKGQDRGTPPGVRDRKSFDNWLAGNS